MKKVLAAIFVAVLTVSLGACTAAPELPSAENAQKAYTDFIALKVNATVDGESKLSVNDLQTLSGNAGVERYAFYDITNDGIPELITESLTVDVFSYQDGAIVLLYAEPATRTGSQVSVLESNAIFAKTETTGTTYRYTTFNTDGRPETLTFFDANSDAEDAPYTFNGHATTKEEWETAVAPFLAEAQKTADLNWQTAE